MSYRVIDFFVTGVEPEPFELGEHLIETSGKLNLFTKLSREWYFKEKDFRGENLLGK